MDSDVFGMDDSLFADDGDAGAEALAKERLREDQRRRYVPHAVSHAWFCEADAVAAHDDDALMAHGLANREAIAAYEGGGAMRGSADASLLVLRAERCLSLGDELGVLLALAPVVLDGSLSRAKPAVSERGAALLGLSSLRLGDAPSALHWLSRDFIPTASLQADLARTELEARAHAALAGHEHAELACRLRLGRHGAPSDVVLVAELADCFARCHAFDLAESCTDVGRRFVQAELERMRGAPGVGSAVRARLGALDEALRALARRLDAMRIAHADAGQQLPDDLRALPATWLGPLAADADDACDIDGLAM